VTDVRTACGAPVNIASDTQIEHAISIVEKQTARLMNTKFTPTQKIDILDGNDTGRIILTQNPVLSVRAMKTNDTSITVSALHISKESGLIRMGEDSESSTFIAKYKKVWVNYLYGLMEESSTRTSSTADTTAGSSVAITVSSIADFADKDWLEIYGMDGHREAAQINTTPAASTITVDQLVQTHESGSIVVKLEIPYYIKRIMELEAGIYIALRAMGSTYTFNTSYTIGDFTTNKGVPYPHFTTQFEKMTKERDMLMKKIRIRPCIM